MSFASLPYPVLERTIQKHFISREIGQVKKNVMGQEIGHVPFFEFLMKFYLQVILHEMNQNSLLTSIILSEELRNFVQVRD